MTGFKHERKRALPTVAGSGSVMGTLLDGEFEEGGGLRPRVTYETAGRRRGRDREPDTATVNWSAQGSTPVDEARRYAEQILLACDMAEIAPREFEPEDEVDYPGLSEDHSAFVLGISDDGSSIMVEYGVPGAMWKETCQQRPVSREKLTRVVSAS